MEAERQSMTSMNVKRSIRMIWNTEALWWEEKPVRYYKKNYTYNNYLLLFWDFKITFGILIFFQNFFLFLWKSSLSKSRKSESEFEKLNPRFLKNSWRFKNPPKIAKLFKLRLWKLFEMINTKFLQWVPLLYSKFCNLRFLYQK